MNEAASTQAEFARRSVTEAYRTQFGMLRDRVDHWWQAKAAGLDQQANRSFSEALAAASADSVILCGRYPTTFSPIPPPAMMSNSEWMNAIAIEQTDLPLRGADAWGALASGEKDPTVVAMAAQGHIRCLLRAGQRSAAVAAIEKYFLRGRGATGRNREGGLVAADELLLASQILGPESPAAQRMAELLAAMLNDYRKVMPSPQRLFLMNELRAMFPATVLPTRDAEQLAAVFLEHDTPRSGRPVLERTTLKDVWQLESPQGRVVALYRTKTIYALTERLLGEGSSNMRFTLTPPGNAAPVEAVAAGPMLAGWQLGFELSDTTPFEDAARRRRAFYFGIGSSVVALMAASAVMIGRTVQRQARITGMKADLVATVTHELKTPLASTQLLVDTLLEDNTFEKQRTREYLELISGENQRLTRLVQNFLTFSRLDRNRQTFHFESVSPKDVIDTALQSVRDRLSQHQLEINAPADLPPIRADFDSMVMVLLNLFDNAIKHTGEDKRIRLRAVRDNAFVSFAVSDNGIGIARRDQAKVFRRFYQVDRRLTRETSGCGLGLSIVEALVRAHGGTVSVASEPGQGSTFTIRIPVHTEDEA